MIRHVQRFVNREKTGEYVARTYSCGMCRRRVFLTILRVANSSHRNLFALIGIGVHLLGGALFAECSFSASSMLCWLLLGETSSEKSATFSVSWTTERKSSIYRTNTNGDRTAPSRSHCHNSAKSILSTFIRTLAVRLKDPWKTLQAGVLSPKLIEILILA